MKYVILFIALLIVTISSTGCGSMYYSQYDREEVLPDSSAMAIADVIDMSKEGIGDSIIISQIIATKSFFELTTNDIIELKKVGVSEKVINAMIKTTKVVINRKSRRYYSYPSYLYPYNYYASPWYSSFNFGFNRGYYNHSYFSGHGHMGNSFGGRHSTGRHR